MLLLLLYQHFQLTGFTGETGFTCLDTGIQDIKYGCLKLKKLHVKIEPTLLPHSVGVDIVYQTLAQLFVQYFVPFLNLMTAVLRMLHPEH